MMSDRDVVMVGRKTEVAAVRSSSWTSMASVVVIAGLVAVGQLMSTPSAAAAKEEAKHHRQPVKNNSCSAVKLAYGLKGFNDHDVPPEFIPGDNLQVCDKQFTCCTQEMEAKLSLQSSHEFGKLVTDKLNFYRQNFVSRSIRFGDYFTELIDQSEADLNDMFIRTYGPLYEQHRQLFQEFFQGLKNYYQTANVNIADVLDRFFSLLMQRVFQLLDDQHLFGERFFNCIGEHMNQLKPFGDIPLKLLFQLKRSFTAARVFVEGLATGRDVILEMSKMEHGYSCSSELMRLTYCAYCGGYENMKPCSNYCLNVLNECLGYHAEINRIWNVYLGELLMLITRLEGPFNMEMVVNPLGVKISEAIMIFQENIEDFSSKVFQGCGEPPKVNHPSDSGQNKTRKRREESSSQLVEFDSTQMPRTGSTLKGEAQSTPRSQNYTSSGFTKMSLTRLLRDTQSKIGLLQNMWIKLPVVLCNETAAPSDEKHDSCWNGTNSPYTVGPSDDKKEVVFDPKKHHTLVEKELLQLQMMINKIKNAHSGRDVDMDLTDTDDESGSGWTNASGEGTESGDDILHSTKDIYIEASVSPTLLEEFKTRIISQSSSQPTDRPQGPESSFASHLSLNLVFVIMVTLCFAVCSIIS